MLSKEEKEDIEESLYDYGVEFLERNAKYMCETWFYPSYIQEMFKYVKTEGIQQNWFIDFVPPDISGCNHKKEEEEEEKDMYELEEEADEMWMDEVEIIAKQVMEMCGIPDRQQLCDFDLDEFSKEEMIHMKNTVEKINNAPVQKQRSEEWYDVRHCLFSASNIYKLFGSSSLHNSLIYEKCKPVVHINSGGVSNDTRNPMNWGIKYESLSLMIYEQKYNTKVKDDYGCIPHPNPSYHIGASPDAINIDPNNTYKFGTLVEVKNIVNREIEGIPSTAYWIQMQMQMEVCDLHNCDFLETRFKEFETETQYLESTHEYKGVIYYMIPKDICTDVESKYIYVPYYLSEEEQTQYIKETFESHPQHIPYEKTYWYLDEMSCVLVKRNTKWFDSVLHIVQYAWKNVEKERVEGYEHRAPKKNTTKNKCMLNIPECAAAAAIDSNGNQKSTQENNHVHNMNIVPNNICLIKLDENGNPM